MLKKNDICKAEITDIGVNGEGIGRVDNLAFFVEGGLPGDIIEFEITKLKKSYGFGKLIKVIKPSSGRITAKCTVEQACGGCSLQTLSYEAQLSLKTKSVKDNLERIGGFRDIVVNKTIGMDMPYNYRNKAQFFVSERNGRPVIGLYSQKTHDVVEVHDCGIQHPINKDIIQRVYDFIIENKISIYNEATNKGLMRSIITKAGYATKEIMVCIVINGNELPYKNNLIEKLAKISGMKSIAFIINKEKSNVMAGKKAIIIWGEDFITDYIDGIKFEISPQSFFQINPIQTQILYKTALDYAQLTGKETVIDAYCGIGTISLFLSKKARKVYGIEIVSEAVKDAKRNAQINQITNAEFFQGEAETLLPFLHKEHAIKPDIIVVDPPRKGLDEKLLETIISIQPKTIIYVSCNPATLARDLKSLCQDEYSIQSVQPVDMFPWTGHVEAVVKLQRKDCLQSLNLRTL